MVSADISSKKRSSTSLDPGRWPSSRADRFPWSWVKDLRQHWPLYLMAAPAVLAIIVFGYGPLAGLSIAFLDFSPARGIAGSTFVGLDNFAKAFANPFFWPAVRNTLTINSMKLMLGFPSAIILALLLNEIRAAWFKRLVQTASILPYFIGWVVAATMFRDILAPDGVLNEVLRNLFGAQSVTFLSDPQKFPFIIVFQDTWKYCGFFAVLYLAAISGIDPTLYEAAMVDGANRWQQTRHITLPGIRPTMLTILILLTGWIIQGGFEQILVMYNTSVYTTGDIIETLTYRLAIQQSKYGIATAIGLFQMAISIALVFCTNYAVRRYNRQGLF